MKPWMRLGIPLLLAGLAFALNYMAGAEKFAATRFVKLARDVEKGEKFTPEHFAPLDVPGDGGTLRGAAVPYAHRAVLVNRTTPRELKKGDVVFWRDANPPPAELSTRPGELALVLSLEGISASLPALVRVGDEIGFYLARAPAAPQLADKGGAQKPPPPEPGFEYVGPFRLLSIGRRVSRDTGDRPAGPADEKEITIAFRPGEGGRPDEQTGRLLQARLSGAGRGVAGIVLHSVHQQKQAADPKDAAAKR